MDIKGYKKLFEDIISKECTQAPYDNEGYVNYVKLNFSRTKRWVKKGILNPEIIEVIEGIDKPQNWMLITEPWCGDAANSVPFIEKMAQLNTNISLEIQLRDSGSEIDSYLTNGGRSIPKLIVRNEEGDDLFSWGPRPKEAQAIVNKQKGSDAPMDEKYAELLLWYKDDNGESIQKELLDLLNK